MKKFKFTLNRLQDFKQTILDKEMLALAGLRTKLAQTDDNILSVQNQVSALDKEKTEKVSGGTTVFELQKLDFQIDTSRRLLAQLYKQKEIQELEVQRQLNVVLGMKSEVQGLEKLRERQQEEYNYALQKENEEIIGELISGQIARRIV